MALSAPRRMAFASLVVVAALAIGEGVSRRLPATYTANREDVLKELTGRTGLVSNADVPGWDIDPAGGEGWDTTYTTNRWRMRGPEYEAVKPANAKRVIFVGDSSIFGVLLDWDETFSAQFERRREAREPAVDWQVANCASPGHSTEQSIRKLERHCLAFEPDYVVIGNQFSDSTRDAATDVERFNLTTETALTRYAERLAGYRLLRNTWLRRRGVETGAAQTIAQVGGPENGTVRRVPTEAYEANLRRMVAMSRDAGAQPVLLMLAAQAEVVRRDGKGVPSEDYRAAMRRVAESESVLLADGPSRFLSFPTADGMFLDPVHPGPLGATILALLLDETVPR
jgi:hypothetical protein